MPQIGEDDPKSVSSFYRYAYIYISAVMLFSPAWWKYQTVLLITLESYSVSAFNLICLVLCVMGKPRKGILRTCFFIKLFGVFFLILLTNRYWQINLEFVPLIIILSVLFLSFLCVGVVPALLLLFYENKSVVWQVCVMWTLFAAMPLWFSAMLDMFLGIGFV